jgi:hypothetical protein
MFLGGAGASAALGGAARKVGPQARSRVTRIYSAQRHLFPVLRRAATAADMPLLGPARKFAAAAAMAPVAVIAQPDMVRSVYTDSATDVGVFPSRTGLCLVTVTFSSGASGTCTTTADAAEHGLLLGFQDQLGHHLVGALPAGSRARLVEGNGAEVGIPINSEGGYSVVTAGPAAAVLFTNARGVTRTSYVPGQQSSVVGG